MKDCVCKSPYVQKKLLIAFLKARAEGKKIIYTCSRKSSILPMFVDYIFFVYNGKSFIKLLIIKEMVGLKLGEFVSTRKKFSFKKQKKLHGSKN